MTITDGDADRESRNPEGGREASRRPRRHACREGGREGGRGGKRDRRGGGTELSKRCTFALERIRLGEHRTLPLVVRVTSP